MTRRVEYTAASERDIRRLDHRDQERIRQAIERLAETGMGDVNRVQGRDAERRLRVGDWRVLLTVTEVPAPGRDPNPAGAATRPSVPFLRTRETHDSGPDRRSVATSRLTCLNSGPTTGLPHR